MGFRFPLTTARAVDTGDGTGDGVRMYQGSSGGFPVGVVEWYSAWLTADEAARITASPLLKADPNDPHAPLSSYGARTTFRGVGANGVPGPTLGLNVEEDPAGGYRSVAALTADVIRLSGQVQRDDTGWQQLTLFAPWKATGSCVYRQVDGWTLVALTAVNGSGWAADALIAAIPDGGPRPSINVPGLANISGSSSSAPVYLNPAGQLRVVAPNQFAQDLRVSLIFPPD